jgi:3-dehydroquinate synthase
MMRVIDVPLGERSYRVLVAESKAWTEPVPTELSERGRCALLVTDANVGPLWGASIGSLMGTAGLRTEVLQLPAGEATKDLAHLARLYDACRRAGVTRDGWLIALGGGVVGDLTGFAAATWLRGVAWVQIPTSLLAMADASVGGKTAINHGGIKNAVGAFHQPRLVLTAPEFLRTLPDVEFANGLAEVIKAAIIADPALFDLLETQDRPIWERKPDILIDLLARSISVKAAIVARDEREHGARALLNLGHTLGHAIEASGDFTRYRHGEAVAIGLVAACQLSVLQGIATPEFRDRVERLLRAHRLPTRCEGIAWSDLEAVLRHDKKAREEGLTYVLTGGIGDVTVHRQVTVASVREAAEYIAT